MNIKKVFFSVMALVVCLFANAQKSVSAEQQYSIISNSEMNILYHGYSNQLDIVVPGFEDSELTVTAEGATFEYKGGHRWICKTDGKAANEIVINIYATKDGKSLKISSQTFRVRILPYPQAYIRLANGELWNASKGSIDKSQFEGATLVCECGPYDLKVESFELSISLGNGSWRKIGSNGNKFSQAQIHEINKLESGAQIVLTNIKYSGTKSGKNLPFEPLVLK